METSSSFSLAFILLVVFLLIVGVSALFYFIQKKSNSTGAGVKTWVNDSNYNIAASDEEIAAINKATPEEAQQMLDSISKSTDRPVSDEVFNALRSKIQK